MTIEDILKLRDLGEVSKVQFKERIFSNAIYLLPYTGAGSGIQRALEEGVQVELKNDERVHEFLIVINRNGDIDADSDTFSTVTDTNPSHTDTQTVHTDTHTDTHRPKLTTKQKDLVNFCSVPRSSREILERAGVSYHSKNIQNYITSLIEAGYLEMTNPENPKANNQKYRKK